MTSSSSLTRATRAPSRPRRWVRGRAGGGSGSGGGRSGGAPGSRPSARGAPGLRPTLRGARAKTGQAEGRAGSAEAPLGRRVALPTGLGLRAPSRWRGLSLGRGGCCSRQGQGAEGPLGGGGGQEPHVCPPGSLCLSASNLPPHQEKSQGKQPSAQRPPSSPAFSFFIFSLCQK